MRAAATPLQCAVWPELLICGGDTVTAGAGTKEFKKLVLLSVECLLSPHVASKAKVMTKARPPHWVMGQLFQTCLEYF